MSNPPYFSPFKGKVEKVSLIGLSVWLWGLLAWAENDLTALSHRHVNLITIPTQTVPLTVHSCVRGTTVQFLCCSRNYSWKWTPHNSYTFSTVVQTCTEAWVASCMGAVLPLVLVSAWWLNPSLNVWVYLLIVWIHFFFFFPMLCVCLDIYFAS